MARKPLLFLNLYRRPFPAYVELALQILVCIVPSKMNDSQAIRMPCLSELAMDKRVSVRC